MAMTCLRPVSNRVFLKRFRNTCSKILVAQGAAYSERRLQTMTSEKSITATKTKIRVQTATHDKHRGHLENRKAKARTPAATPTIRLITSPNSSLLAERNSLHQSRNLRPSRRRERDRFVPDKK